MTALLFICVVVLYSVADGRHLTHTLEAAPLAAVKDDCPPWFEAWAHDTAANRGSMNRLTYEGGAFFWPHAPPPATHALPRRRHAPPPLAAAA